METSVERINDWLGRHDLSVAPKKTEAIALRYGRPKKESVITVAGMEIEPVKEVKYLGVILDSRVRFRSHIRAVTSKAESLTSKSSTQTNAKYRGSSEEKRKILGAPVWADVIAAAAYRSVFQGVQRRIALKICRTYRTTSFEAATLVARIVYLKYIWDSPLPKAEAIRLEKKATMDK